MTTDYTQQLTAAGRRVDLALRKVDQQRERRDDLIIEARAKGMSYRAIGRALGMTHQAVVFIEERHTKAEREV